MTPAARFVCDNGHPWLTCGGPPGVRCPIDRSAFHPDDRPGRHPPPASPPSSDVLPPAGVPSAASSSRLRILFDGTPQVTLGRGEEVVLGRDPAYSVVAGRFAEQTHVSRRHAVVGLDRDGTAWLRDCYALNRTRINGLAVGAGERRGLANRDTIGLCAGVTATIELIDEEH